VDWTADKRGFVKNEKLESRRIEDGWSTGRSSNIPAWKVVMRMLVIAGSLPVVEHSRRSLR